MTLLLAAGCAFLVVWAINLLVRATVEPRSSEDQIGFVTVAVLLVSMSFYLMLRFG